MAAGQQYKAVYEFASTGEGILSFKSGDQFTLVSKTNEDWWSVRSVSGENGLAPVTYLEACPVRNGGALKAATSAAYTAIYDYSAGEPSQLSFSKGEPLFLVDKTDVSWWTMQTAAGKQGLVPVNYIDKLDLPGTSSLKNTDSSTPVNNSSAHTSISSHVSSGLAVADNTANSTALSSHSSPPDTPSDEDGFHQVLDSIDCNIARIHTEATKQGGLYSPSQKGTLQKLVLHRQSYVMAHKSHVLGSNHTHPPPPLHSPPKSPKISPKRSPIPKRHAPPPPKVNGSDSPHSRRGSMDDVNRKQSSHINNNRFSLQVGEYGYNDQTDLRGSTSRKVVAPAPPTRQAEGLLQGSQFVSEKQFYSLQRPPKATTTTAANQSPPKSHRSSSFLSNPPPSASPPRRASESVARKSNSPEKTTSRSLSHELPRHRSGSAGTAVMVAQRLPSYEQNKPSGYDQSKSSYDQSRPNYEQNKRSSYDQSSSSSPHSSSRASSHEREVPNNIMATTTTTPPHIVTSAPTQATPPSPRLVLPTAFSSQEGAELVETVRKTAGITHRKAQQAVGGVLEFIKRQVPQCESMVDALFAALEKAMHENSVATVSEKHSDLERLKEILFEITDCKDDSQQRGWAVHDDERAISDLLDEMLQILCDANPEVSKVALMEDKYENVLTLITYYQMEPRVSIRLLLLKVFGVLCGLDSTIIGILLASVLPNELGRDIQQNMQELQKALYSGTVCTMIFSTAEALPLSVYDQWDVNYVMFLLDSIEEPPAHDHEEQLPDAFLNMVLAFNQHFPDPASNLVMRALKQRPNPRNFSEKLMFLINRGEDPVAIAKPCCPDSITKFLLDLFSEKSTAGMFYTTDMRVLIDIVVRQLTDLCPGMPTRTHYLELLYRIVASTDYRDHLHRQRDLVACLNRVANEEEDEENHADKELVKKIWMAYPQVFEEITDL